VASRYCIVSVPIEPLWRMMNIVRGAYLRDFGNTPGHVQHWAPTRFRKLLAQRFDVLQHSHPIPWQMYLCKRKD